MSLKPAWQNVRKATREWTDPVESHTGTRPEMNLINWYQQHCVFPLFYITLTLWANQSVSRNDSELQQSGIDFLPPGHPHIKGQRSFGSPFASISVNEPPLTGDLGIQPSTDLYTLCMFECGTHQSVGTKLSSGHQRETFHFLILFVQYLIVFSGKVQIIYT